MKWFLFILVFCLGIFAEITIPKQSDWTERGVAVTASTSGWDKRLYGQISPCTAVKKNGKFFLYYIGADGNRSTDGGPRNRALGVATSTNGINFTKYSGNPVIRYQPHNNQEEGVFSAGAMVDDNGEIVLYYGAIWASNSTTGSVDVYTALAVSQDGFSFSDKGIVYKVNGEEEEPIGVFKANGKWNIYTIQNGGWYLNLLSGPSRDNLTSHQRIGKSSVGGCDPMFISPDKVVLFNVKDFSNQALQVFTAPTGNPAQLTLVDTYNLSPYRHTAVYLDKETSTWFMYQGTDSENSAGNKIIVRTAPMIGGDDTPPTTPSGLNAASVSGSQIDLSWSPAGDGESGIASYKIYRGDVLLGSSDNTAYSDVGLSEATTYSYQVSAVNGAGLEGAKSDPAGATTLADNTPPSIVSVSAAGNGQTVVVVFSEPVQKTSAENPANYTIDNSINVSSAVLNPDLKTVTLGVSELLEGITYTLTVNNVKDLAKIPNTIAPNTQKTFMYIAKLELTGLAVASSKPYKWETLANGIAVYIDRTYTFSNAGQDYLGAQVLITANDDKSGTANPFISFDANQDVTVYVGYASTSIPGWLSSWTSTGNEIQTTDRTLYLYSKDFSMGQVTLGGNESASSMYTVIVSPAEGPVVESDMRHLFPSRISARVHPNPCHNSIRIQVGLPIDLKVDFSIYDVQGREVFASVKADFSKGSHAILWKPIGVSPGIFFIRLRAGKTCIIRKLILLK